jgi:hypothetical protein
MVKDWLKCYDFIHYFSLVLFLDVIESETVFLIFLFRDLIYIFIFIPSFFLSRICEFLQELYYSFENIIFKQPRCFEIEAIYASFPKFAALNHSCSYFFSTALFFLLLYRIADICAVIPRCCAIWDYPLSYLAWKRD